MEYLLLCDCRENLKNYSIDDELYNDHPSIKNINEILDSVNSLGYPCQYFGGVPEIISAIEKKENFCNCIFLNFTDGRGQKYSRA